MLNVESTAIIVIDVQEKLVQVMNEKEKLLENIEKLVKGALILKLPIIVTEQYPEGLGTTVTKIKDLFPDFNPITKVSFSCCGNQKFMQEIAKVNRCQVLICGIESHVCVYQTAVDLLDLRYEVQVVSDCISSRSRENLIVAIERMKSEGIKLTSVEMALFELLKSAKGDNFKEISKIIK